MAETVTIAAMSAERLRALCSNARRDPALLASLLCLSAKEGAKESRRVEAALGISKKERLPMLREALVLLNGKVSLDA